MKSLNSWSRVSSCCRYFGVGGGGGIISDGILDFFGGFGVCVYMLSACMVDLLIDYKEREREIMEG